MMIYLALCDDDAVFRLKFKEMLTRVLDNAGIFHHIYEFESGEDLLENYPKKLDILFLDIKMASLNGLETAKLLREQGQDFLLIFITSAEEYVYDAFEVEAFRYLLKPADDFKLEQSLFAAVEKKRKNPGNFFIFHRNHEVIKINLDEVLIEELEREYLDKYVGQPVYVEDALFTIEASLDYGNYSIMPLTEEEKATYSYFN